MSKRFTAIAGRTALTLAVVAAALQGCGGAGDKTGDAGSGGGGGTGGGGTNGTLQQLCAQFCEKADSCFAGDGGTPMAGAVAACKTMCNGSTMSGGTPCTNASSILSGLQGCLQESCDHLFECYGSVRVCQVSGAGGSTGAAGSGASKWTCDNITGTNTCVCAVADVASGSCTGSCCYTMGTGATAHCFCDNDVTHDTCLTAAPPLGGTVVPSCQP